MSAKKKKPHNKKGDYFATPLGAISTICSTVIFVKIIDVLYELITGDFKSLCDALKFTNEPYGNFLLHLLWVSCLLFTSIRMAMSLLALEFDPIFQEAIKGQSLKRSICEWIFRLLIAVTVYLQYNCLCDIRVKTALVLYVLSFVPCIFWDWLKWPSEMKIRYWQITDPIMLVSGIIMVIILVFPESLKSGLGIAFSLIVGFLGAIHIGGTMLDFIFMGHLYKHLGKSP